MADALIKVIREERRWFERSQKILEYHNLQSSNRVNNTRNNKWKVSDTARELDMSVGAISEAIQLARAIRSRPDLRLKTREDALRILRESRNGEGEVCQN